MKLTGGKSSRAKAPASSKKKKKSGGGKIVAIVLVIIVIIAGAATALGVAARGGEKIFPNVSYSGVAIGGKTTEEATLTLITGGYDDVVKNAVAQVRMPNGENITMSAKDAGLLPPVEAAVANAYDYGRNGGLIGDCVKYIKGLIGVKTELAGSIDEESGDALPAVYNVVSAAVSRFNLTLGDDTFTINENEILIVKGAGHALADADSVYDMMCDALYRAVAEGGVIITTEYNLPDAVGAAEVDLLAIYNMVNVAPVDAEYDTATSTVSESVVGVSFDMAAAQSLIDNAEAGATVRIPLIHTEPDITSESLNALLLRDILSERTTYIDGTSNRLNNITLAAAAINGTVLNPGEEFSYNGVVGERTVAKGYKSAGAYSGGRTVQEIGGGICQVSSAIYYCTLYADLEVTSRRNHQFTVAYLPLGQDATVNWGTTDYKFKNNTDYPIRIDCIVDGRNLTVQIVGTKTTTDYIKVEYVTLSSRGFETIEVEDESIAPGTQKVDTSGHTGVTVETYKYRYKEDGTLIEKVFIAKSAYNPQNRIILVPVGTLTGGGDPTPSPTGDPTAPPTSTPDVTPAPTPTPEEPTIPPDPTAPPATPTPTDSAPALPDA